ncbi:MAG: YifB family Mg chelatase-like AAA ATPase [Myxococcota bacterium]
MAHIVHSMTLAGIDGLPVSVEVDLPRRLPATIIVGLPGNAIRESSHRVRSAIGASGKAYPKRRVVVNLAPANLPKVGTAFDLPIAIGILFADGQVSGEKIPDTIFMGELSLDGELRPIDGAIALAIAASEFGAKRIVLPAECAAEACVINDIQVLSATNLIDVLNWLDGHSELPPATAKPHVANSSPFDLAEVRGQYRARRALEIAAAGGHNLLMIGSPGCGKTMLAARMPTILPALTPKEAIEITRIHSVAGILPRGSGLTGERPFRSPHHSISAAGLVGNARLKPGEVSLAHNGVLFLDELAEFNRKAIEVLRGPLEHREVHLTRAQGTARYPASFSLVAAANPCPCGYNGHPTHPCICSPSQVDRYKQRLSGPLLDRIDLQVWVQPIGATDLVQKTSGEASNLVRLRVNTAREHQRKRFEQTNTVCNAELQGDAIREAAMPTPEALDLLRRTLETHGLSGRAWARLLKVARTISDLDEGGPVQPGHILEASTYRLEMAAS